MSGEISRLPQELAYFDPAGEVVMSMTGACFDEAQQLGGVQQITPDKLAMTAIARGVGFIGEEEPLPPLVLFARSGDNARRLIGRWDDRWPQYNDQPMLGRYFSAASIGSPSPENGPAHEIAGYAKHIGASAITEITIEDWAEESSHVKAFAGALLFGQRPIEPQAKPSLGKRLLGDLTQTGDNQRKLNAVSAAEKFGYPEPFRITRSSSRPQLDK